MLLWCVPFMALLQLALLITTSQNSVCLSTRTSRYLQEERSGCAAVCGKEVVVGSFMSVSSISGWSDPGHDKNWILQSNYVETENAPTGCCCVLPARALETPQADTLHKNTRCTQKAAVKRIRTTVSLPLYQTATTAASTRCLLTGPRSMSEAGSCVTLTI